jgi:hypothetical protein
MWREGTRALWIAWTELRRGLYSKYLETLTVDRSKLVLFDWRRSSEAQVLSGGLRGTPTTSRGDAMPCGLPGGAVSCGCESG